MHILYEGGNAVAEAYVNLGATLVSVGRGTEAMTVLRAGASLDGSALKDRKAHEAARVQALLQLGSLYAEQGRLHKALSSYREALRMLPEHYPPQVTHCTSSRRYIFCSHVLSESQSLKIDSLIIVEHYKYIPLRSTD